MLQTTGRTLGAVEPLPLSLLTPGSSRKFKQSNKKHDHFKIERVSGGSVLFHIYLYKYYDQLGAVR